MTDTSADPIDDLTPREPRTGRSRSRRWVAGLVAVGVVVVIVVLVWRLFTGTLFFYNADEAVERRVELGDDRFTLQGSPIGCSIMEGFRGEDPVVAFSIAFDGVAVDVVHFGDPAELFDGGVPVVLDGAWVQAPVPVDGFAGVADDGWYFASDRMRVKHDEDYTDDREYEERLDEATHQTGLGDEVCGL